MNSHLTNSGFRPAPQFSAAIVAARPDSATSYRLKSVDTGRYFPPHDQSACPCSSSYVKTPSELVAGTYEVVYYREPGNPDTVLTQPENRDPPTIQVSQDAVLLSPADFELVEQRRWQAYEQRELGLRHKDALVRHIEQLTKVNTELTSNAIERDAALTDLLKKFTDLQTSLTTLQESLITGFTKQTDAVGKNLVTVVETAQQSISKIKTDNAFSLGTEVVKSIGAVLQAKVAADAESPRERRLRHQEPPRAAIEGRRGGEAEADRASDEPPRPPSLPPSPPKLPPPPPMASAAAAKPFSMGPARRDAATWTTVEIDWLQVCDRSADEPPPVPHIVEDAAPASLYRDAHTADDSADSPAPCAALAPVPDEISALVEQVPELKSLFASLGLVRDEVSEKPADWSYGWAWRAIKRRIASLSDTSIAWLLSSVDNALGFLRELAELATPPPDLSALEGGA